MYEAELVSPRIVAAGVSTRDYLAGDWPPDSQLIDGEVIVTDPAFRHNALCLWFATEIETWVRTGPGRGAAGFGCSWVAPIDGHVYKPDVWWLSESRKHLASGDFADAFPDLVIEVRSPGTWSTDLGRKRMVYELGGVSELWFIDRLNDLVLVDRRPNQKSGFERVAELAAGQMLTTPLLPGLELDLRDAFDR